MAPAIKTRQDIVVENADDQVDFDQVSVIESDIIAAHLKIESIGYKMDCLWHDFSDIDIVVHCRVLACPAQDEERVEATHIPSRKSTDFFMLRNQIVDPSSGWSPMSSDDPSNQVSRISSRFTVSRILEDTVWTQ